MYLKLKFNNAELIKTHRKTKDWVVDYINSEKNDRKRRENGKFKNFKEPITVYQISNMLHVLFGERPSPTRRETIIPKDDYIFNKAKESYLKINNILTKTKSKGDKIYISEIKQLQVPTHDSNHNNPIISWEIISKLCGDKYFELITKINETLKIKDCTKFTYLDIKSRLNELNSNEFYSFLDKDFKPIRDSIKDGRDFHITKAKRVAITYVRRVDNTIKLHGEILIPVNEDDLLRISKSKGVVGLLDGGIVYIDSVLNDYEIGVDYIEEFKLVSEISTEYED